MEVINLTALVIHIIHTTFRIAEHSQENSLYETKVSIFMFILYYVNII